MRGPSALAVLLITSALIGAPAPAPGPAYEPAGPRPLRDEARVFALQLLRTIDQVATRYVRPVSREELLRAALTGLYAAARLPAPPTLAADMREALAGKTCTAAAGAPEDPTVPEADRPIVDLIQHVRENIGDPPPLRDCQPLIICCQAVARELDPYSGVVSGKDLRRNLAFDEYAEGFGIELRENGGVGPVVVEAVLPGGPAQQAGVRPGDEITHIDGRPVRELERAELLRVLHQPPDVTEAAAPLADVPPPAAAGQSPPPPVTQPPVQVALRRPGSNAAPTVLLESRRFRPEAVLGVARQEDGAWTYWVDSRAGLAHVRLASLSKGAAGELRRVVSALHDGGLRGLVLDLRWCPGGFLDEAVDAARIFLDEGTVATIHSRGKEDLVYRSDGRGRLTDFPVVVLVNGETCGGAELIAAALQDRGRAAVAGQRTVGKASVQTQLPLSVPGAALKLTSGVFVRPDGKDLQRGRDSRPDDDWGVRPDAGLEFRVSPDLAQAIKRDWQRQTLRPGSSAERLPMDDPDADPQRQAALEALRGRVQKWAGR